MLGIRWGTSHQQSWWSKDLEEPSRSLQYHVAVDKNRWMNDGPWREDVGYIVNGRCIYEGVLVVTRAASRPLSDADACATAWRWY